MRKLFNPDNPVMRFLGKIADLLLLSVLWFVCCLPVVTIGVSTTALYFVALRIPGEDYSVVKDFFRSFKQNFCQGLVAGMLAILMIVLVLLEGYILLRTGFGKEKWAWILFAVLTAGCLGWTSWVFPILAKFECTWSQLLKTPLMFSILHFFTGVIIVALNLLPFVAVIAWADMLLAVLPVAIMLAPSGIALLNSLVLRKVFSKYENKE